MQDGLPVSVAELLAAGERLSPGEAVAITLDLCGQVMRRQPGTAILPPISSGAIFLDGSGTVTVAGGPPAEDDQTVSLLARLLLQMLPEPGAPGAAGSRVPARLRLVAERAASGEPGRMSVQRLAGALRAFGPVRPQAVIRALFLRWASREAAGTQHGSDDRRPEPPRFAPAEGSSDEPAAARRWFRAVTPGRRPAREDRASRAPRRSRRARMPRVGLAVVLLLVVLGLGASYWLNADQRLPDLPDLPVSPSALISEPPPPPPRTGWELLPDPCGLAADASAGTTERIGDVEVRKSGGAGGQLTEGESAKASRSPQRLQSPFAHPPDQ